MASKYCNILLSSIFLVLFVSSSSAAAYPNKNKKQYKPCKRLVYFYHDILYNGHNLENNATSAIIAAPKGRNMTGLGTGGTLEWFGVLVAFDGPLTLDENLHSKPAARAQGMYFYDQKRNFSAWFSFVVVINNTDYQGSFSVTGADNDVLTNPTRDLSIVGGTGDFFMHRGICTLSTSTLQGSQYFRLKFDLKFYECW